MHLIADIQTGLRLAFRARFASISLWLIIALITAALLAAQFSGRQPATVALDVGLSVIRLALPLAMVLLVQELITQEFGRRYYLTSVTYPRPRYELFLGRFLAIFSLGLLLLLVMAMLLAGTVQFVSQDYAQATPVALGHQYLITLAFIGLDLFVLTAMAALLAIVASTPSFVLIGTFGFILVARSYSSIITLLEHERYLVDNPELYQGSLKLLSYVLPDLGALDVRMLTLYGKWEFLPEQWPTLFAAVITYGLALLALAIWFLNRKRFN
mgnify:CR=1 FL=1